MTAVGVAMRSSFSRFTFDADVGAAGEARRRLVDVVRLDPIRFAEAQLLVSELITNALQHGGVNGPGALEMTVESEPTRVRVAVSHTTPPGVDISARGMGLTLVEHLARRWGVESSESRFSVWFEIRPAGTRTAFGDVPEDEVLARAGSDQAYRDEAVHRYRGLAESLAARFRGRGVSESDLEQVALVGLLAAVSRYDPAVGPFKPYAILTIQGSLKRCLRDRGWSIRVPRNLQERSLLVAATADSLTQRLGRAATADDVAAELDMPLDDVREAVAAGAAYQWDSIDAPGPATGFRLSDTLIDVDGESYDIDDWRMLTDGVRSLTPREQELLRLRFHCDMTQSEIADQLGISQMHVSRLLAKALERLRRLIESSAE